MKTIPLLIGGGETAASNGAVFTRRNPVSGAVVTTAAAATVADAEAAVAGAAAAFPAWSARGPNDRRSVLLKAADLMEAVGEAFIANMMTETGSTREWAAFNVHEAAKMIREAASLVTQIAGQVIPSDIPGSFSMAVRAPVGVCLGIAPWNARSFLAPARSPCRLPVGTPSC